jgi:hypothetical protein
MFKKVKAAKAKVEAEEVAYGAIIEAKKIISKKLYKDSAEFQNALT